jgi:hypothetical protein
VQILAPIDLFSDAEYYHKVFACYVQVAYHAGVAYLMARRYGDAKRTFAHVVLKVKRRRHAMDRFFFFFLTRTCVLLASTEP